MSSDLTEVRNLRIRCLGEQCPRWSQESVARPCRRCVRGPGRRPVWPEGVRKGEGRDEVIEVMGTRSHRSLEVPVRTPLSL